MLSAITGAPLLPVGLWFTGDGWGQWIGEPIHPQGTRLAQKVAHGTQGLADQFAWVIGQHPTDWHMLQKLWLGDLGPAPATGAVTGAATV